MARRTTVGMETVSPSLLTRWTSLQRSDTSLSGKVARESNQQWGDVRKVINRYFKILHPHHTTPINWTDYLKLQTYELIGKKELI